MAESSLSQGPQVRLELTTRDQHISIEEPPIQVPTSFRRYALSSLVNGLLGTEKPIPLEFLINGTYLRTSIEDFLTENGISTETTLTVEYLRARVPPIYTALLEHDDWVSSVDVLSRTSPASAHVSEAQQPGQARILTSNYDGYVRVWNSSSQVMATSKSSTDGGHASIVTDARFVSPTQIASSGFDRTVRLWKYTEETDSSAEITPQLHLYGHKGVVQSIRGHAQSNRLLSASADHTVGLWSTKKGDAPPAPEAMIPKTTTKTKRRKLNPAVSVAQRGPLALLQQHTGPVSGAIFDAKDSTVGYSASWDHTVRTWDLVTASLVDTRTTANALFAIEQMPQLSLIATGSAGRDVKLVDVRASATTVTAMTLRGHRNTVVTLARDPGSEYVLVSGSHDGTCKVWDIRSTKQGKDGVTGQAIYTINRESSKDNAIASNGDGMKVFGVCWDKEVGILSGGEDKTVQINRGDSIT